MEARRDLSRPATVDFSGAAAAAAAPVGSAPRRERLRPSAGHLIRRMNQIAVALFLEETSGFGLTNVQYAALHAVARVPNVDQARLGSMIALDKATLVKVLDRLARKGLITRTRSADDRRSNLLNVTGDGRRLVAEVAPRLLRCEQRTLAPLAPEDRRKFMALLERLVRVNNVYSRAPLTREIPPAEPPLARPRHRPARQGGER